MRCTEEKIEAINEIVFEKKKENPISKNVVGIGIKLSDSINGATAFSRSGNCDWSICTVEDLNRTIIELTMLKEAIEEESGIIL